jgi:riboflavin kinase/FMN adenylyltransferase
MKVIKELTNASLKDCVVILGNFDGIHKGHLLLIDKAKEISRAKGWETVLFTFFPHPTHVLTKNEVKLINTDEEKQYIAETEGMDYYVQFPFTEETALIEAETFIEDILIGHLGAKAVIIGTDYSFGKDRRGDVQMLIDNQDTYGFEVHAIEKLRQDGTIISSTWIRDAISQADVETANMLMGREYFITGTVIKGRQLGRSIGFPTANIKPEQHKQLPQNGVYITKVEVKGKTYYGLTNVGTKPTIDINLTEVLVESYIYDFDEDIYGETIIVKFFKYIRTEDVFETIEDLIIQMKKDEEELVKFFKIK